MDTSPHSRSMRTYIVFGLFCLSTYNIFLQHIIQNDPNIPIFWAHGRSDTEIPLQYARNSIEFLEQRLCMNDETLCYLDYDNLGHEVSEEVFRDFSQWLSDILSKNQ